MFKQKIKRKKKLISFLVVCMLQLLLLLLGTTVRRCCCRCRVVTFCRWQSSAAATVLCYAAWAEHAVLPNFIKLCALCSCSRLADWLAVCVCVCVCMCVSCTRVRALTCVCVCVFNIRNFHLIFYLGFFFVLRCVVAVLFTHTHTHALV